MGFCNLVQGLRFARRRFAGAERGSRLSQEVPTKSCCERVRSTKGAPRNPFGVLEGRHGLAEISERGAGVLVERPCVIRPGVSDRCSTDALTIRP